MESEMDGNFSFVSDLMVCRLFVSPDPKCGLSLTPPCFAKYSIISSQDKLYMYGQFGHTKSSYC